MAAGIEDLTRHIAELLSSEYSGWIAADLRVAAAEDKPVNFAVYPDEQSEAARFAYECDLYGIKADDLDGFAHAIAEQVWTRYVTDACIPFSPEDIYCVDIF